MNMVLYSRYEGISIVKTGEAIVKSRIKRTVEEL